MEAEGAWASRRPTPAWLAGWTVKADLTLIANEQGGISPSGSYAQFVRSAPNTAAGPTTVGSTTIGTFQQFFTFGASLSAGEQAVRTETISFTVSLKELAEWRRQTAFFNQVCALNGHRELLGNLGLAEWIDAALFPVSDGALLAGNHPPPGSSPKPSTPSVTSKPVSIPGATVAFGKGFKFESEIEKQKELNGISDARNKASAAETDAAGFYRDIQAAWLQVQKQVERASAIQATYGYISTPDTALNLEKQRRAYGINWGTAEQARNCTLRQLCGDAFGDCSYFDKNSAPGKKFCRKGLQECGCSDQAMKCNTELVSGAIQAAACVSARAAATNDKSPDQVIHDTFILTSDLARLATNDAANAKQLAEYAKNLTTAPNPSTPDPPIDALGHTVQFVVALSGSIAPNWTLIAWRGPAMNGPGAGASLARTHLLQLALGSPSAGQGGFEQNRLIQNNTVLLTGHP